MKYNKYSAIVSLIFTIIPFISALILNYIHLPFAEESSFKVIMGVLFVIAWFVLAQIVVSIPDSVLRRLKLIDDSIAKYQKYWLIEYDKNDEIPCTIIKLCDNCEHSIYSNAIDYSIDLSEQKKSGIFDVSFDSDGRISKIITIKGGDHSFLLLKYNYEGEFNVTRIDENNGISTSIKKGLFKEITYSLLLEAKVITGEKNVEKLERKLIHKFGLTENHIEKLLEFILKKRIDSPHGDSFAEQVITAYNQRKSSIPSIDPLRVVSQPAAKKDDDEKSNKSEGC